MPLHHWRIFMAKALLGYMSSDLRDPSRADRLAAEVRRLREHVGDLESLLQRLQEENDRLSADRATWAALEEMQPA
jgi:hypothetical protein